MTAYALTNRVYTLTGDISLTGSDTIDFIGTPTARGLIIANGFRIYCPDASFIGHIKFAYCDVFGLGTAAHDAIGGTNLGDYFFLGSSSFVDIQNCIFNTGGGFNFFSGGTSSIKFNYNKFYDTNFVPTTPDNAPTARAFFFEQGPSTVTKEFKGNRIYQSWASLGSDNWIVGAAPGATNTEKDTDGNICIGRRVGFNIAGSGSYVSYNYTHVDLSTTPVIQFTSQNYNLQRLSAGSTAEHNVFRTAHWVCNGIDGILQKNIILELDPHNFVRIGTGIIRNNILATLWPGLDRYNDLARKAIGDSCFGALQVAPTPDNLTVDHNTVDCRGKAIKDGAFVTSGARFVAIKNTILYKLYTLNSGGVDVTSGFGLSDSEGYPGLGSEPNRADYLDYNDVFFAPSSEHNVVYGIKADSLTLGNTGWGGHDLGTLNGQGVDPQFNGPLTIGSGQTGTGGIAVDASNFDSGFPFNDSDILNGIYTVRDLLSYFRWIYAPVLASPCRSSASDGDNRGAVLNADIPGSAPAIASTNKIPMVYAGPSYTINLVDGATSLGAYSADDGLPGNTLTFQWTKVSGPGNVAFSDSTKAMTQATFSAVGYYVLRLIGSDGTYSMRSDCTIRVI